MMICAVNMLLLQYWSEVVSDSNHKASRGLEPRCLPVWLTAPLYQTISNSVRSLL